MNESSSGLLHPKEYRPDIDGLRCIAVGSVIAFHAFPGYAPAGFFGVDIFFVISGYLITSILSRHAHQGRLSIREFYIRRIRRILPALVLLLGTLLAVGWFTLVDSDYSTLGLDSAAAAGFSANLLFWHKSNYFFNTSDLLHLWSLGVEEQFYFIWPLLIYAIVSRKCSLPVVLSFITVLSLAYSIYLTVYDPTAAFYSPLSRCWELSTGGLVASLRWNPSQTSREALALTGLFAIAASILLASSYSMVPGFWALLPVAGTASVIQAGAETRTNRLLSFKPFVWIGLISYPLYLWHWPALQFVLSSTPIEAHGRLIKLAVLLSVVAAALTYVLVERPLRQRPPLVLLLAMFAVFLASIAIYVSGGVPGRAIDKNGRKQFLASYAHRAEFSDPRAYRAECDFLEWHSLRPLRSIDARCTARGQISTRLLWGDSHAQALSLGLRSILPVGGLLAQVATSGCPPSIESDDRWLTNRGPFAVACRRSNMFALEAVHQLKPQIVYIAQAAGHEKVDWESIALKLRQLGAQRVILIGPVPQWHPSLASRVAPDWPNIPSTLGNVDADIIQTDNILRSRKFKNLTYVSVIDEICKTSACVSKINRDLLVVDYGHLSGEGSKFVAQKLSASLNSSSKQ